jgi:zinc protease
VAGQASPQDLETLFQLIYLAFTAPRRDEGVFASFRTQLAEQLEHQDVDPHAVFAERRQVVLFGNHPRRRPLVPGDEKKVSLDRALDFYRARFANAANFTFVIVGSVHLDTLAPLVTRYLGALPARPGHHETWRDLHIRPVSGVHKFEVKKGHEPQSTVGLTFSGTQRYSEAEDQVMSSLIETVSIRLREVLREGMSGTYNVHVSGDLQRRPDQRFSTNISFGCAPENLDSLVAATFHELDEAKAGKLAAIYTEKVRPAQDRAFDQGLTTNPFWLEELAERYEFGEDPLAIPHERTIIDAVTPAQVQQAAARYFDQKSYLLGVLRPEAPAVSERKGRTPPRVAAPAATPAP